jgi:ribosomal protein S18 acetylase RimI-like enzyme
VLELLPRLSPAAREALGALESRTVEADGGRLKLEWGVLNTRTGDDVHDLLWWEGERLRGFVGLYSFGGSRTVELAGMVDPAARRRHIGTALLDAALPICRERGYTQALLVTPRNAAGGREFALARGAVLDHSEHALVLRGEPNDRPSRPDVTVRRATSDDVDDLVRLLDAAFGSTPTDVAERLNAQDERTLLVEVGSVPVGTVRLTRDGATGGIYGLAVDPRWQGRGIGRDVLGRVCRYLRAEGAQQIGLEVAVENERALGLYTSVGFEPVTTEDYYALQP